VINGKYPINGIETEHFNFTLLRIASLGILAVYISEMINRMIFFDPELPLPVVGWRIADSIVYATSLIILAFQCTIWVKHLEAYENRKRAKYAVFLLLSAGLLTALYEILLILMPEEQRLQSDYTVPFLLMIITHFVAIIYLKTLIEKIGRSKKVEVGLSLSYILFAANPAIRYLLPFVFLIGIANPILVILYSELIMTYITAFIAIVFVVFIFIDTRKIQISQMVDDYEKEEEEKERKAKQNTIEGN